MIHLILALIASLIFAQASFAQGVNGPPGFGWSQTGQQATSDMPYVTVTNQPTLSNERALAVGTGLTLTDGGANGSLTIAPGSVLSYLVNTGASTNQAFTNSILNLSGLASGDIIYYDGANWSLVHKGASNTVFGVNGSGVVGYYSPSGAGTVTNFSVVATPSWLSSSVANPTSTPALTLSATSGLTANQVLATPDSVSGAVGPRALVANDIPNISAAKITSGALAKAQQTASTVYNDQSNTYTGTFTQDHSASGQTLRVPLKTDPGSPATGEIWVNAGSIKIRDNAGSPTTQVICPQARAVNTTSPLSGGGALTSDLTLTLGTVAEAKGGTNQTTYAQGDILYASAANTLSKLAIGTSGKVLGSNGTIPGWVAAAGGFGGNGADGAIAYSTNQTFTGPKTTNATTWATSSTAAVTSDGPYIILCNSTFTLASSTSISINASGGAGGVFLPNCNGQNIPGAGMGAAQVVSYGGVGTYTTVGGGGGGYGALGGLGGSAAGTQGSPGGSTYPFTILGGSGGASGQYYSGSSTTPGNGGKGGGALIVCAVGNVSISGNITASGAAGTAGTTGNGGGGGSGGGVGIFTQGTLTQSAGTITTNGGAGGNASSSSYGAGGGGGAGRQVYMAPTAPTLSGTRTLNGGAAGSAGSATLPAGAGANGTAVSITGTPNMPLIGQIMSPNGCKILDQIALEERAIAECRGENFDLVRVDGNALIRRLAGNDLTKFYALKFERQCTADAPEQVEGIGDSEALANAA